MGHTKQAGSIPHTQCISGKPDETSNMRGDLGWSVLPVFPFRNHTKKNSKCDSKGNNILVTNPPRCSPQSSCYLVKHIFHHSEPLPALVELPFLLGLTQRMLLLVCPLLQLEHHRHTGKKKERGRHR